MVPCFPWWEGECSWYLWLLYTWEVLIFSSFTSLSPLLSNLGPFYPLGPPPGSPSPTGEEGPLLSALPPGLNFKAGG